MTDAQPLVSIFVPCRTIDRTTEECIQACLRLTYDRVEIIVLPDEPSSVQRVQVIPTGKVTPGRKRNIGASAATGEIFAYIDSDAYPRSDWISNAVRHLRETGVGAVGGPGLTPEEDGRFAQVQGMVLSSKLMGGIAARYSSAKELETDDIHSVNFIAWRRVVQEVGGWDEHYWPGEDTIISLRIKKAGYRQLLASDVVVYHHRRPTWAGYSKQIWNYAVHRGFFAKRFPETSRRLSYFVPSLFLSCLVILPFLSVAFTPLVWLYFAGLLAYLALLLSVVSSNKTRGREMIFIAMPFTHIVYGAGFMVGLSSRSLPR